MLAWLLIAFTIFAVPLSARANGADLPAEIILQGFARLEEGRIRLVVRIPLVLLASFSLPKRGPGYLDLARIDQKLDQAATSAGRQIEFSEDGVALVPAVRAVRLSLLSDRSFETYAEALAHLQGPPLAADTDLYWNQGYLDVALDYPIRSPRSDFSIRLNVAPELGERVKLELVYLSADGTQRRYALPGGMGVPLDPRWYETLWVFLRAGFFNAFAGERFAFLAVLVVPFRRFRSLLAVVLMIAVLQALTLTATAIGVVTGSGWVNALYAGSLGAAVLLLAIANLSAPLLRRRLFISAAIGGLGGYGIGHILGDALQFAGSHDILALASFNAGLTAGGVAVMAIVFVALRIALALALGPVLGVVVLSTVLGHLGWHWMSESSAALTHEFAHAAAAGFWANLRVFSPWVIPALVVGVMTPFVAREFGGAPIRTLRSALLGGLDAHKPASPAVP